jgi:hypothetical protein
VSSLVVRDPELKFKFDTPTAEVDLSCYTVAVDIGSDAETIDVGTFCAPGATEVGKVTETVVVAFLWEEALYTALQAHIGEEFTMLFKPIGTGTKVISCTARYAALPWGRFEIGQRVEADLTLAVLSPLVFGAAPAGA